MANVPRGKTVAVKAAECMITCHTSELSTLAGTGTQHKVWHVFMGQPGDAETRKLEVHLDVDKAVVRAQKVKLWDKGFEGDGDRYIYPQMASRQAAGLKLDQDLVNDWKFKGTAKINKDWMPPFKHMYEIRQMDTEETWWPGIIDEEHDGRFNVRLWRPKRPDQMSMPLQQFYAEWDITEKEEVPYQGYPMRGCDDNGTYADIRLRETGEALKIMRKTLRITVPRDDPLHKTKLALLEQDMSEHKVTEYFARASPVEGKQPMLACIVEVCKLHKMVSVFDKDKKPMGQAKFQKWVENEVSYEKSEVKAKNDVTWYFRIGHYQHKIRVHREREYGGVKHSKYIEIFVDDTLMIKSTPEDMVLMRGDGTTDTANIKRLELDIQFKSVQTFTFRVFQTNRDGVACSSQPIDKLQKFNTNVKVNLDMSDLYDFQGTILTFNEDTTWTELQQWNYQEDANSFKCELESLENYYCKKLNLKVPYVIDESAKFGMAKVGADLFNQAQHLGDEGGFLTTVSGWLSCMCGTSGTATTGGDLVPADATLVAAPPAAPPP